MSDGFLARLEQVQSRIAASAARSGRSVSDITLIAVTKTHPAESVLAAYAAGLRDFGENRLEGLRARQDLGLSEARWHMIGAIQSRKVKEVVGLCDVVHSVDRTSLAEALNSHAVAERSLDILVQVNASGEASKSGWHITTNAETDEFIAAMAHLLTLPQIRVRGLMTMAPFYENSEMTRPIFARLRTVLEVLRSAFPNADIEWLSMGMTNDYEIAIEEGATHVRIGTALFGERR